MARSNLTRHYTVDSNADAIITGDFNGDGRLDLAVGEVGGPDAYPRVRTASRSCWEMVTGRSNPPSIARLQPGPDLFAERLHDRRSDDVRRL